MARPNDVFDWGVNGDCTRPPDGRMADGYKPADPLHAQYFNWLLNTIGRWIGWIKDTVPALDEQNSFSDVNTFTQGVSLGSTLASYLTTETTPVMDTVNGPLGAGSYKLIYRGKGFGAGAERRRIYVTGTGTGSAIAATVNAYWTGAAWAQDNDANASTMIVFDGAAPPRFLTMAAGFAAWRGYADLGMAPVAMGRVNCGAASAVLASSRMVHPGLVNAVVHVSPGIARVNLDPVRIGSSYYVQATGLDVGTAIQPLIAVVPGAATFDVKARTPGDGTAFNGNWQFTFALFLQDAMAF